MPAGSPQRPPPAAAVTVGRDKTVKLTAQAVSRFQLAPGERQRDMDMTAARGRQGKAPGARQHATAALPRNALVRLAGTLGRRGIPPKAGQIIPSGFLVGWIGAAAGDPMRVAIGGARSASVGCA